MSRDATTNCRAAGAPDAAPAAVIVSLDVGAYHVCALATTGAVWCWGANDLGQLGKAAKYGVKFSGLPGLVADLPPATSVTAGWHETCTTHAAEPPRCWGDYLYEHYHDPFYSPPIDATSVVELGNEVSQLRINDGFACAVKQNGEMVCWGEWLPTNVEQVFPPVPIPGLESGIVAVAPGIWHVCATRTSAKVSCLSAPGSPVGSGEVALVHDVIGLAAGHTSACALQKDGTIWCWGDNEYGQLGRGFSGGPAPTPAPIASGEKFTMVSGKYSDYCGVTSKGQALCWGHNDLGQLGSGGYTDSAVPMPVVGLPLEVSAVHAGYLTTCAIAGTGGVWCWGAGSAGALGDGKNVGSAVPVQVKFPWTK